jgi:hypothetical protein
MPTQPAFRRHVERCNNVTLPGHRLTLVLDGQPVGFVEPSLADDALMAGLLSRNEDGSVTIGGQEAFDEATRRLAGAGLIVERDERFDIRATEDGPPLATLDRGALPLFGIAAAGVHLNGLVTRDGAIWLWVARRASNKLLDPGKLDHLAAGGVPAGMSPRVCLAKEADEECGLSEALIGSARLTAVLRYAMERPEGLRRDVLHCYDIMLPETWQPVANDGEVEAFELWPLRRAYETVRDTDDFKFNVSLVLIDLFARHGLEV